MAAKGSRNGRRKASARGKMPTSVINWRPVIGSGLYTGIHLGTHLWTHTDIHCLRHLGCQGMRPHFWYNLSWSSHDLLLVTIPSNVAALQEQVSAVSGVVGNQPLIYGANVWHNLWPNEQLEVGQPQCIRGSSWSLQSADDQLGEGSMHRR